MGMIIGIVVALIVIGGGAFFYIKSENDKKEAQRIADETAAREKKAREDAEKARLAAEQKARDEEAARKKREEEMAQKLAAAEAARQQAIEDARKQEQLRLANARGTAVVTTEPAGATVTLGSLPPRPSPATFTDVKIGKYPVTIALAQHEEVKTEVEVKENATTELPLVKLVKIVGAIDFTSDPEGVNFEFHPGKQLMVAPELRHTGTTPAKVDGLAPGEYTVTFTREGWQPHTETVKVERDGVAKVSANFPNGVIKITSSPDGATVTRNGARIGVTPLTLSDQQPGNVKFELSLANYEPATLMGRVESGKLLVLQTALLSVDRLASLAELDEKPKAIATPQPDIPSELADKPGKVLIEFTVTKLGATKDVKVLEASSPELGKAFVEAINKWKFKPGSIGGKPMNARVQQPFVLGGAK